MTMARTYLSSLKRPALFVAREQTTGRGRSGRVWYSPPHLGLYLSMAIPGFDIIFEDACYWNFASAAVLYDFCIKQSIPVRVKWPNDLVTQSGKLAGVLVEWLVKGAKSQGIIIGIGINVKKENPSNDHKFPRVSLEELGCNLSVIEVFRALVPMLARTYHRWLSGNLTSQMHEWFTLWGWVPGSRIQVRRGNTTTTGSLVRIGATGTIEVEFDSTTREIIPMDEVITIQSMSSSFR